MFESLEKLPADPILGLLAAYQQDTNPHKVDLGVGVYKDEAGHTAIMTAVKKAEQIRFEREDTKTYIGPGANKTFANVAQALLLGQSHAVRLADRVRTAPTPGGCGALRVAAEFIKKCNPKAKVWVSDPTWANHIPLIASAGIEIKEYPYFDEATKSVKFDAMIETLKKVPAGDMVLLHGCCHNPCGADLTPSQWDQVADLAQAIGFVPFIDIAYQGLGNGLEADAYGLRAVANKVPEMIIAQSFSKNFGLYRERAGSISIIAQTPQQADAAFTQVLSIARSIYSMPPAHGPAIVEIILTDDALAKEWQQELASMCDRMNQLRNMLVDQLEANGAAQDFDFIRHQRGMFSFIGITPSQVQKLIDDYSIYMVNSSRVNIAGISQSNVEYLAKSIAKVL
jgi:aspartate aminotransferase